MTCYERRIHIAEYTGLYRTVRALGNQVIRGAACLVEVNRAVGNLEYHFINLVWFESRLCLENEKFVLRYAAQILIPPKKMRLDVDCMSLLHPQLSTFALDPIRCGTYLVMRFPSV
jgi:hypothetical protein